MSIQIKIARALVLFLCSFYVLAVSALSAVHGYLPAVVEVPVGVQLQLLHLLHLIQHLMHIELGHEELQATMTVSLTAKQQKHVSVYLLNMLL